MAMQRSTETDDEYVSHLPVQLILQIVEIKGPGELPVYCKSTDYGKALKKTLCDFNVKEVLIGTVDCNFEYTVLDEKCSGFHVNIMCKFSKESDLLKFKDLYKSNQLAERLEEFLRTVGVPVELGIVGSSSGKDIRLEVEIDQKYLEEKHTPKISWTSSEYEETKTKKSCSGVMQEIRRILFRVHFQESYKLLKVSMSSEKPELDGIQLSRIACTNLWEANVEIAYSMQSVPYHFILKFDDSMSIPFQLLRNLLGKKSLYKTSTYHLFADSDVEFQIPFPNELKEGYFSHCSYILESVNDEDVPKYTKQMINLTEISKFLDLDQRIAVLKDMIQLLQRQYSSRHFKASCTVFVFYLSNNQDVGFQKNLPHRISASIFQECSSIPTEWMPPAQLNVFLIVLGKVFKCAFQECASFLSFCSDIYPLCDIEICSKLLATWRSTKDMYNQVLPSDPKEAKQVLKTFINQVCRDENLHESSKAQTFLKHLQRQLPFEQQILIFKELKDSVSRDASSEILHSTCERKMVEFSKEGRIVDILDEWEKMSSSGVISIDSVREKAEKCLVASFDKAPKTHSKNVHKKLKEMIVNGNMFREAWAKVTLMEKFAESFDKETHSLVVFCLQQEDFHDVSEDEVEKLVLKWFDQASNYHCCESNFNRNDLSNALVRLYAYLGYIHSNSWLSTITGLLKKLEKNIYECLKSFDVIDIIKAIPKMDKFENEPVEDMFKSHIQELFKFGLENEDFTIQDLIGHTQTCTVNSKVTLQLYFTMMECSGLRIDMELEKAMLVICNTANLWKSIWTVKGKKKDELLENKLCIKAKNTVLELKQTVENKTISIIFFQKINKHKELCQELFNLVHEHKDKGFKSSWMQISDEIDNMFENLQMAINVFQTARHKIDMNLPKSECVGFSFTYLQDKYQILLQGNVSVKEAKCLDICGNLLQKIRTDCRILTDVVKSDVFWNISLQFFDAFEIETEVKEELDNECLGINSLFEENETEAENDAIIRHLYNGCRYLDYLLEKAFKEYEQFWFFLLSGKNVLVSTLQKNLDSAETMSELQLAERIFNRKANTTVQNYIKMYSEFEQQSEIVDLMKGVLDAFDVDLKQDNNFQRALFEYEKLLNGDIGDMTLSDIGSSLVLVAEAVDVVEKHMIAVLRELKKASVLIEFLQTVVDEDIRNLIDAVEEHSEQFVRESTVSDLIEVKRFLQPILKQKNVSIRGFFQSLHKSLENSGIKNAEQKVHECCSNLHSLKALYNHVANRGEHTKEIIENIIKRGIFHFYLREKECDVTVEYKQDKKTHAHSKNYLNDLRSRALLILNAEEKQYQQSSNKKEHLAPFIEIIDSAVEICHLCALLKESGHFQYVQFDHRRKKETLQDLSYELKSKYEEWCKVLRLCREKFYLMNYIHSDQLPVLYSYTKNGQNKDAVVTILNFIHPGVSDFEYILSTLQQSINYSTPENELEALGKTLDKIGKDLVPAAEKMFDRKPKSKFFEIVQEGRLFVAALEPDSQLIIRSLLALHWNTTQNIPFAHNVLFCNKNTSQDEITLFLNRCQGCKTGNLFSVANVEKLAHETQDFLVKGLGNFNGNTSFRLALLCIGNRSHPFLERFGDLVMQPKALTKNELQQFLSRNYPNVLTMTSDVPGLGKTEVIQRRALENDMGKVTLHISGIFDKESIVEELMHMKIKPYHILHIDIGPVDEPQELDTFLFELIVLKHVSARKCAYHMQTDHISVEIANTVNQELSNCLPTVTSFTRENITWENYNNMIVSKEVNSPVQVVCHYLQLKDLGLLDQTDLYLTGEKKVGPLPDDVCKRILQKHFSTFADMSFTVVNIFLGVFADQLKKLSSSVFFRSSNIQQELLKSELVNALKNMSGDFSSRSINTCRSTQMVSLGVDLFKQKNKYASLTCAEILAKRTEGMIRWEDSNQLMVLFHHDLQTVSALYRIKDNVPKQICNLFESQLKRSLDNFGKKSQEELMLILRKLVQPPGIKLDALNEASKRYALTPDNLLKMVLIVLRMQGQQPIIIMGETGCGKTSLIRFLSLVCQIDFQIFSIHAGITEEVIIEKINDCDRKAKENFQRCSWLFLDEINTCDHLGLICDIICHHFCKGKLLSPNLKVIAACNPYRLRSDKSILTTGLQDKIKTDQLSKLVYRVNPLPETMIDYVWDYGSLQKKDEEVYIKRMVQGLFKDGKLVHLFVRLLIMSQRFVQDEEGSDCCVSLRDVERCRRLVGWFVDILRRKDKKENYCLYKFETGAIILALSICYHSRFPDNEVRKCYRENVAKCCEAFPELKICDEQTIETIIVEQQNDILDRMELPPGTAKNTALRENVFVILVCILNRIPVFVVGKPGCSKSLSMQLIRSNLRGKDSSDYFFKSLPQLYCVSFQGSESSTSDGIIKVFEKAKNYQNHSQSEDVLSVVILDEIGLAEISRFNPLKVLHSLLEPENQDNADIAVVGISNWALDAAKMNRAIHLSRPEMDEKELFQTALSITESLLSQPYMPAVAKFSLRKKDLYSKITKDTRQLLQKLAHAYSMYSKKQSIKNFHGLRDFYSLIKYIGKGILLDRQVEHIDEVIIRGLLRNLGGLSIELRNVMLQEFQHHLQTNCEVDMSVLDLIRENLLDKQSRHLMLITNGDAVLSVLEDTVNEMSRQHVVIFGSRFADDLTDDYNYRILNRIILCMEQGYILILKDLENIYGSLYDMLNQNYTTVGSKKNCRVALGPYSNPMCHVHDDFKCIVLVEEAKLDFSDPPFLNRFEKQQFRFEDMMDKKSINIRNELIKFTLDFCEIDGHSYKPENVFALSGENVISSLVLKMKKDEIDEKEIIQKCQNKLLWIIAPEAMVRIKDSTLGKTKRNRVSKLAKMYYDFPIHNGLFDLLRFFNFNKEHKNELSELEVPNETSLVVVFTYDFQDQSWYHQPINIRTERLRNFKSEKHLNQTIKAFFESESKQLLLHCNVAEDMEHILLAKSSIENCQKNSSSNMSHPKHVCIICHLDRQDYKREQVTQINFLSAWKLAFLDTLCEPKTTLPKIINLTVEEMLESRRPTTSIVRDHIFWCFTTIQYVGTGYTAEKMMDSVCSLKESKNCLTVLEELVFSNIYGSKNKGFESWQQNVACNEHALVKASCYMNALEQYLLDLIKNPLSKIIFKLEESNALQSVFVDDSEQTRRFEVWRQLVAKDSFMDISNIPDPTGPECYTCSSERCFMKLPFSFIVLCRVEKIKDDFINTVRHLKMSCGLHEDEDVSREMLSDLVEKYSDVIEQNITEYLEIDYPEKFREYKHDFCLMMSSHQKGNFSEEERVQVMDLALTIFDIHEPDHGFALQVTHIHVLRWMYSSVLDSVLDVMNIVKECTNLSVENLFFGEESQEHFTISDSEMEGGKRNMIVDRLCNLFLPTTTLIKQFSSVQEWQYQVSRVLPCFAEISLDPSSLYKLRFCNDVANAMFSTHQEEALKILSIIGDELSKGTRLDSNEMCKLVTTQSKIALENKIIDISTTQRLFCQYLSRSINIEQELNSSFISFLKLTNDESIYGRSLQFFGPILKIVIEIENDVESVINLIDFKDITEEGYLYYINESLKGAKEDIDSNLSSLLVAILQDVYDKKVTPESLRDIQGSSDELCVLAIRAANVLRKQRECSLNLVASIAYLRSILKNYIKLLLQNKMNGNSVPIITQTINTVLESGDEEHLPENLRTQCLQVFFLKRLFSDVDLDEVKKYLLDLKNGLTALKSLNWEEDSITRSFTFHPLLLYTYDNEENWETELQQLENMDKKRIQEVTDVAKGNSQAMFSFIGCLASTFYLKTQQKENSDTCKGISKLIFESIHASLPTTQRRVVELLLKMEDFNHPFLLIDTETKAPDIQIVSVLSHLLSLVIFKGQTGNLFYDILMDVNILKSRYIPGNECKTCTLFSENKLHLCETCKIKFINTYSKCPKCDKTFKIDTSGQTCMPPSRKVGYEKPSKDLLVLGILSPVTHHLLQFIMHACALLATAVNIENSAKLELLLCLNDDPNNVLQNILLLKWKFLQSLTQLNNENLCALVHVVIHDLRIVFETGEDPFNCKTAKNCEDVEKLFQSSIENTVKKKYVYIGKARSLLYKKLGMDSLSLECQIHEICVIEGSEEKGLMLPRLFRMTNSACKDGMVAQVFLDNSTETFPFLSLVLMREEILALPKFILPILRWHHSTVSLGSYKMRKVDCKEETIERFFRMEADDKRRRILKKRFEDFKNSWNDLIRNQGHLLKTTVDEKDILSNNSKVIKCIITDEQSVVQKVFLELVNIQNYFIDFCLHLASKGNVPSLRFLMTGQQQSQVKSTPLWELSANDIIKFESLDDTLLGFSECNLNFGEGQNIFYDLVKMENELTHELILGKPHISVPQTFPRILFVDELFQNTIQLLENIRKNIYQDKLPQQIVKSITKKKESDNFVIPQLMTVLGMALSLLKKTKGEPNLSITEYLEDWKDLAVFPKDYRRLFPEPEDAVKLCHVVNLYVKLEELNGEIIHETLDLKYKDDLPPEGREKLETAGDSYVGHLEVLAESLKIFVHRCLSVADNTVSLDQGLIEYISNEEFWPQGNLLEDGHLSVGGKKKNLSEILCSSLCVKHIYNVISFIQDFIQEKQEMDQRVSVIAASHPASDGLSKTTFKRKMLSKKFGKT